MSNDKVKQEAPERVWLLLNQEGRWISTTPEAAQYVGGAEYVRADLLAAVRREEREAAGQIAFAEAVRQGISAVRAIAIKSKIEASASEKEGMK